MKEQLISFETAKLAKEKGFDWGWETSPKFRPKISSKSWSDFKWSMSAPYILRPTQSLLQKWLREKHNLDVSMSLNQFGWGFMYAINNCKTCDNIVELKSGKGNYWSYEEALEKGLQEALQLIK